ncbi:MAG TPA: hypothetical protein PL163_19445 [Leptospiraceae bacterium]|nr:hypothetical protein [Leptospiraceae bacterium]
MYRILTVLLLLLSCGGSTKDKKDDTKKLLLLYLATPAGQNALHLDVSCIYKRKNIDYSQISPSLYPVKEDYMMYGCYDNSRSDSFGMKFACDNQANLYSASILYKKESCASFGFSSAIRLLRESPLMWTTIPAIQEPSLCICLPNLRNAHLQSLPLSLRQGCKTQNKKV